MKNWFSRNVNEKQLTQKSFAKFFYSFLLTRLIRKKLGEISEPRLFSERVSNGWKKTNNNTESKNSTPSETILDGENKQPWRKCPLNWSWKHDKEKYYQKNSNSGLLIIRVVSSKVYSDVLSGRPHLPDSPIKTLVYPTFF